MSTTATKTPRANWRTPDAYRVDVDETTDRAAWLSERRNGIGGTDAAALLGVHVSLTMSTAREKVTPAAVFMDKTSPDPPVEVDRAIFAFGHLLEPHLLAQSEARWGIRTKRAGLFRNTAEPWRYANADALASDGGIVECKTTSHRSRSADAWLRGDVSPHAYAQTQHYLAVTGRTHSYYAVAIRDDFTKWEVVPRGLWGLGWFAEMAVKDHVFVGPVPRDEAFIDHLLDVERGFWEHVRAGVLPDDYAAQLPPEERWRTGTPDTDVEADIPAMAADDLRALASLKSLQGSLRSDRAAIEQRIKATIGGHEYLTVNGERRARWQTVVTNRLDTTALKNDHPDIAAAYMRPSTERRLTIVRGDGS